MAKSTFFTITDFYNSVQKPHYTFEQAQFFHKNLDELFSSTNSAAAAWGNRRIYKKFVSTFRQSTEGENLLEESRFASALDPQGHTKPLRLKLEWFAKDNITTTEATAKLMGKNALSNVDKLLKLQEELGENVFLILMKDYKEFIAKTNLGKFDLFGNFKNNVRDLCACVNPRGNQLRSNLKKLGFLMMIPLLIGSFLFNKTAEKSIS